ncbi:class I SAM-dependent methyltransferase [Roseococcus thiosulfatophilus]|uniref:class I SAM-dependent methyltransferase n=1 Tax=Roseococcus thiosulfatophilus TaxID=35813 RepID=UPI001A8C1D0B|nr:class I SAM-dependent methyltransferase [Roseococcus thiosulfatophilus]
MQHRSSVHAGRIRGRLRGMDPVARDYDAVAAAYRREVSGELAHKPMDRDWLRGFARAMAGRGLENEAGRGLGKEAGRGLVGDVGCGPGHVTAFLAEEGVEVLGLDLSPGMVETARAAHPGLRFEVGDLRTLDAAPGRFAGLLAMYSLIHLEGADLPRALAACHAALRPGGQFRAAVHLGEGVLRPGRMWGVEVGLGFRLFAPGEVEAALRAAGFTLLESRARPPVPGHEYPSQRGYVIARR